MKVWRLASCENFVVTGACIVHIDFLMRMLFKQDGCSTSLCSSFISPS